MRYQKRFEIVGRDILRRKFLFDSIDHCFEEGGIAGVHCFVHESASA